MSDSRQDVIVVGAGLSGLCCALELTRQGIPCRVVEAADGPGGRVRTDEVDGFLLDRGFQVLLTAYPEVQRTLDLRALKLGHFLPGTLIRLGGQFHTVADPFRRPFAALASLKAPVGSFADKRKIAALRKELRDLPVDELWTRPESSTREALARRGFDGRIVDSFFRPFLSGIFLEGDLATSSRLFEFVFRMFSDGYAALPAQGMGAIAQQLASRLPTERLRYGARVEEVAPNAVRLAGGECLPAKAVVIAADLPEAVRLLPDLTPPGSHGTACLYFAASEPPVKQPILVLAGEGSGPINHLCVPSTVARSYAPSGQALISASTVGVPDGDDAALERDVRQQLGGWFGPTVASWRHLRTYRIPFSLPARASLEPAALPVRRRPGLYICGDHRETPSLQGAMASGRRAAEAVATDWSTL
jgi:phytoene dehydrogenase-like protein